MATYSNEDYLLELIVDYNLLEHNQVEQAKESVTLGHSVIEYLVKSNIVTEEAVAKVCAASSSMDFIDLASTAVPPHVFEQMPKDIAKRFHVVPVAYDGNYLTVALADPLNFEVLDTLPHILGHQIITMCATSSAIEDAIKLFYNDRDADIAAGERVDGQFGSDGDDAPVIQLVNDMMIDAFKQGASDIHIEPLEMSVRIRFRLDGKLLLSAEHPKKLLPAIIARIKVMTNSMKIAEKRLPQDGRVQMSIGGKEIDLRVSSVPSNHGESIVMRILDKSALSLGMDKLGFLSDDQETFNRLIGLPDGIILVTGPTGSGKTTTLYSCLHAINRPDKKIITVEDPVEYELPGINQVMVRNDIGMTFVAALRAMLRQAPNVIMVGEIRDAETANIAINASLTGHLVFSTLHTNDAPSAIARLADIGVKPFLIASALRAVMAQRLVRKLCINCKRAVGLSDEEKKLLRLPESQTSGSTISGPKGCDKCRNSGYKGRMGLFEIMNIDDEIAQIINQGLSGSVLKRRARELGMRTLREDGVRKMLSGLTSASEVISSTSGDNF
ncbi:ATPase, T2SS/T4P/T4SS family [Akkermansiaceae bacterium]|nr:ATPase, T2SS/T4P/T4SS family [Akkermansiaceae bacterium]